MASTGTAACKAACRTGKLADGTPLTAMMGIGRPPNDPKTGKRPPAGSYGPWSRCAVCMAYLIWEGRYCPCCGQQLAKRVQSSRARNRARQRALRSTREGAKAAQKSARL